MASRKRCRLDEGPSGEKRPRLYEYELSESGSSSHESVSDSSEEADGHSFSESSTSSGDGHNSDISASGSDSNDSQLAGDDCFEVEESPFVSTSSKKLEHTVRERCQVAVQCYTLHVFVGW